MGTSSSALCIFPALFFEFNIIYRSVQLPPLPPPPGECLSLVCIYAALIQLANIVMFLLIPGVKTAAAGLGQEGGGGAACVWPPDSPAVAAPPSLDGWPREELGVISREQQPGVFLSPPAHIKTGVTDITWMAKLHVLLMFVMSMK